MVESNRVVVGSDLYEIAMNKVYYRFHLNGSYNIGQTRILNLFAGTQAEQ